jgi:hypothetical protein
MAESINTVTISGMIGANNTYFADDPVVITISGLEFPANSPIKVVRVKVLDSASNVLVGEFVGEAAGASPYSITFDISSALRAMWAEEDFAAEVAKANLAAGGSQNDYTRYAMSYMLNIFTEYISEDGVFTKTQCAYQGNTNIPGGQCIIGGRTEWERYLIDNDQDDDVSSLNHKNPRNGDASTKPLTTPEIVGSTSITSWVDVGVNRPLIEVMAFTKSIFYPYTAQPQDDDKQIVRTWTGHAPIVVRDTVPYVDFLFVNRRGAVETCSGQMLEAMSISVETKQSARVELPSYKPNRTVTARATGGRRSWTMSSGHQTREWAEWWTMEFLMAKRHWMRYPLPSITGGAGGGSFVPVTVTPAKKSTAIYDRTKQEMAHADFTVTLALEG